MKEDEGKDFWGVSKKSIREGKEQRHRMAEKIKSSAKKSGHAVKEDVKTAGKAFKAMGGEIRRQGNKKLSEIKSHAEHEDYAKKMRQLKKEYPG